jgi:hypothetical protein
VNEDFQIANCGVDAAGYSMTIKGSGTSKLTLFNHSITNAAKFELNFGNGHGNLCDDGAISVGWRISADKVDIHANGGISVGIPEGGGVGVLADSISVRSKFGDICVTLGFDTFPGLQADKIEVKSDFGSTKIIGPPLPP